MIQNVLTRIGGVENYGIISICLFILVFTGAFLWACSLKKSYLKNMEVLPLQDDDSALSKKGTPRHE